MDLTHLIAWFFGAAFLTNALPHFIAGSMGRPFQTPFAKPPGQGLSSSTINVLWGFLNFVFAYLLLCRGDFQLRALGSIVPFGLGTLSMGLMHAMSFGRFNGGRM